MLLLPDQTYEQYQGEKTLTTTPLLALKRLLSDANFCPKIPHFDTHVKKNATQNSSTHVNGFFGINLGNVLGGTKIDQEKQKQQKQQQQRCGTPDSFKETCDFFNNIPEFHGEALGPFSIPKANRMSNNDADLLKECELLLYKYRIRPDFFCRYGKAME